MAQKYSDVQYMDPLSEAEVKVAALVVTGMSNHEIASQLKITEKTVKFHLTRIYKKTGHNTTLSPRSKFIVHFKDHGSYYLEGK